jgi:hypothetical protein
MEIEEHKSELDKLVKKCTKLEGEIEKIVKYVSYPIML